MTPAHHTPVPWSTGVPGPSLLEETVNLLIEVISEVHVIRVVGVDVALMAEEEDLGLRVDVAEMDRG